MNHRGFYSQQLFLVLFIISIFIAAMIMTPANKNSPESLHLFNYKLPGICLSKALLNSTCPGCGLTRSFTSLAHLEISNAFYFNRIGPVFALFLMLEIPLRIYIMIKGPQSMTETMKKTLSYPKILCIILMVINWLANLLLGL